MGRRVDRANKGHGGTRMSLLLRIQEAAIDSKTNVGDVLRHCAVLAAKLGHQPFRKWVNAELSGYPAETELPPYRILKGLSSIGHFMGPGGEQINNVPLPIGNVPEAYRHLVAQLEFRQAVGALAALIEGHPKEDNLTSPWPADLIARVSDKFIAGRVLMSAYIKVPRGVVVGVIEAVRNRILTFALEIEEQAPAADEVTIGSAISQEKVTQIFTTNIWGGANISVGSANVSQTVQVKVGDLDGLKAYLGSLSIEPKDLDHLAEALKQDKLPQDSQGFGDRVSQWIGYMTSKAASGTWKVGVGAAGDLLASAIRMYYGWP